MRDRIFPAIQVYEMFEMEKELGELICPENVMPDLKVFKDAISKGKDAAHKHENCYGVIEKY